MKLERELDKHDYGSLHDALYELTNKTYTNEELDAIIEQMPSHIKAEALAWGFNDTCVCDQVYVWYRDEVMKIKG